MALDRFARFWIHKSPAIIDAALRDIVRSAYDDVSLFREKLDAIGITPNAVRSRRDLQKLPITSSDKFRDCPTSEYTNRNVGPSRRHKSSTSGTMGVPLYVYRSRSESAYRKLVLFNAIHTGTFTYPFRFGSLKSEPAQLALLRGGKRDSLIRCMSIISLELCPLTNSWSSSSERVRTSSLGIHPA